MSKGLKVCGFYYVWSETARQGMLSDTKHREIPPHPPHFLMCLTKGCNRIP